MRRLCTALLAAALMFGFLAVEPVQAKVYKMKPEERAAALKEKRAKRTKAKKSGTAAPGQGQGGWVEVKPGEGIAKKNRKAKVDEIAKAAEQKGKKGKKSKRDAQQAAVEKPAKGSKKSVKGAEEIVVEKKGRKPKAESKAERKAESKAESKAEEQAAKRAGKKSGTKAASRGDRASSSSGERKVSASSAEVRRPFTPSAGTAASQGAAPAAGHGDDLSGYSVSRPGQDKTPAVPEVRHEVQPGPLDTAKPLGTEQKAGEGRF